MPSSVGVRTSCCIATQVRRRRTDNKRRTDLNAAVLVRSTKPLLIKEMFLSFFYAVAPSVGRRTLCCYLTQVRPSGTETERRRDYLREGFGAQHQAPTETSQSTQN